MDFLFRVVKLICTGGLLSVCLLQNAHAESSEEYCQTAQETAQVFMMKLSGVEDRQDFKNHVLRNLPKGFDRDFVEYTLDQANQRKLSADPFEQLNQAVAFGKEMYQDCLVKINNFYEEQAQILAQQARATQSRSTGRPNQIVEHYYDADIFGDPVEKVGGWCGNGNGWFSGYISAGWWQVMSEAGSAYKPSMDEAIRGACKN